MWFSPIKGAYMTLGQIDKTLPVDGSVEANKAIRRGMVLCVKPTSGRGDEGKFELFKSTNSNQAAMPYIALQAYGDYTAGAAGNVGIAENNRDTPAGTAATSDFIYGSGDKPFGHPFTYGPRITGLSLAAEGEYQIEWNGDSVVVGDLLTVDAEGYLAKAAPGATTVIVGIVTKAPFDRWINDLGSEDQTRKFTGGKATVIQFATRWEPGSAAASSSVGEPVVAAAKATTAAKTTTAK